MAEQQAEQKVLVIGSGTRNLPGALKVKTDVLLGVVGLLIAQGLKKVCGLLLSDMGLSTDCG